MKKTILFGITVMATGSLLASPKDDVAGAAAALANQSYSWTTTTDTGGAGGFTPGPQEGKTEKDGYTSLSLSFGDNATELLMHGTNAAVKTDAGWQSAAEAADNGGGGGGFSPGTFAIRMTQNFQTPAQQVTNLIAQAAELKAGTNGITGALTEDGAKSLMARRGGRGGGSMTNPKGSVTFWITDGKLVKFQTHVTGSMSFNGNDMDIDRTTTTELKDIGSTKVAVPDDAKKKLQ